MKGADIKAVVFYVYSAALYISIYNIRLHAFCPKQHKKSIQITLKQQLDIWKGVPLKKHT